MKTSDSTTAYSMAVAPRRLRFDGFRAVSAGERRRRRRRRRWLVLSGNNIGEPPGWDLRLRGGWVVRRRQRVAGMQHMDAPIFPGHQQLIEIVLQLHQEVSISQFEFAHRLALGQL